MFGENLKAMRKAKGYTQEELAIKINVIRQTVSKWEKGETAKWCYLFVHLSQ